MMKKILAISASLMLVVIAANAQSGKKEPPPPQKPEEEVKYKVAKDDKLKDSPKVVNEEIKVKEPPPPPPQKPEEEVKYKIVADEKIKVEKPPVITVTGKMADDFYERNQSVANITRQGNIITLKMKDGTIEKYDMSKKEEDKNFTGKYGRSSIPPPPPPKIITKQKSRA